MPEVLEAKEGKKKGSFLDKEHIDLVGVELEGGWNHEPEHFHEDRSVSNLGGYNYHGESNSDPLKPELIEGWILRNYPDEANASCGLHVHVSFTSKLKYMRLMDKKFQTYFLNALRIWGETENIKKEIGRAGHKVRAPFWARLEGNNTYCATDGINSDLQAIMTSKGRCRYKALNFCYSLHGTLEIRVLPVFKQKELAVKAVKEVLRIINAYFKESWNDWFYRGCKAKKAKVALEGDNVAIERVEEYDPKKDEEGAYRFIPVAPSTHGVVGIGSIPNFFWPTDLSRASDPPRFGVFGLAREASINDCAWILEGNPDGPTIQRRAEWETGGIGKIVYIGAGWCVVHLVERCSRIGRINSSDILEAIRWGDSNCDLFSSLAQS